MIVKVFEIYLFSFSFSIQCIKLENPMQNVIQYSSVQL